MPLQDVKDPNVGRVSSKRVQPGVQTAVGEQATPYNDPLMATIMENASKITQTELNKSLAKDTMRGYLQMQEGATVQDVKENAPAIEQIFGEGASIRGAQAFVMQSSMDKHNLDIIENMNEYRKMSPEAFREQELDIFESFLTGDPDTDAQLSMMQAEMFRQSTADHTKANMAYEQEVNSAAWYGSAQTKVALTAALQGTAISDEEKLHSQAMLEEVLARPDNMTVDSYNVAMTNLAAETMSNGNHTVVDYIDKSDIYFTASQLGELHKTEAAYSNARTAQTQQQFGVQLHVLLDEARALKFTDTELITHALDFAKQFAGVDWSGPQLTRILEAAKQAREKQKAQRVEVMSKTDWRGQVPASYMTKAQRRNGADQNLAVIDVSTPDTLAENVAAYTSSLTFYNEDHTALTNRVQGLFDNPAHPDTGEPPPYAASTYMIMTELRQKKPSLFNSMFTNQAADFFMLESLINDEGGLEPALQEMARMKQNKQGIGKEFFQDEMYTTTRDEFVNDIGRGIYNGTLDALGLKEFPDNTALQVQMASSLYDMHRSRLGDIDQSRAHSLAKDATMLSLAARTEIIDSKTVDNHGIPYYERMGLRANESPSDAIDFFINGGLSADPNVHAAGLDLPDGYRVQSTSINHVTNQLVVATRDGSNKLHFLAYNLESVGENYRTDNAQMVGAQRNLNKVDSRITRLADAKEWMYRKQGLDGYIDVREEYDAARTIDMTDDELLTAHATEQNNTATALDEFMTDLAKVLPDSAGFTEIVRMHQEERRSANITDYNDAMEAGTYK
jgi:hypothetical protein